MILIRSCQGNDELEACVQLQVDTWGYDPTDVIPRKAFLVWQKVGGQVIGAFDTDLPNASPEGNPESLIGFVLALPGVKQGHGEPRAYLHSHMMAVKDGYRNRGIGVELKLAQRQDALKRGIRHIEWTFDPLEIKNAFLNIHKLPTDRLVAEWELDSAHVEAILEGSTPHALIMEEVIHVPVAIYAWKATDAQRENARAVQTENRQKFQEAFSKGLAVLGFVRDAQGNGTYELGQASQLDLR
jgi:predicted GNAT superfamily acetyltransferase